LDLREAYSWPSEVESIRKTGNGMRKGTGYGGHLGAIQAFKYLGKDYEDKK